MAQGYKSARIGVDVGGTFTDLVLHDAARGIVHKGKLLTTPHDPSEAILAGVLRILKEVDLATKDLHSIVHGTTLVTNTIIERTGAKIGLLTTAGFKDTIEIGRETRYDLYDLFLEMPAPLVPRSRRLEIAERISASGEVLHPLDEEAVARAAKHLIENDRIEALAISFLHAHHTPVHELRAAGIVRRLYPDVPLSLSSEVAPEIREYERSVTACANAYVQPLMHRYLDKLVASLKEHDFGGSLYIMLSGGGITSVADAKAFPIRLIESGPAAGAIAASFIAGTTDTDHVLSFDMGGTTAKMCVVDNKKPNHKFSFEAGRVRRFQKGSGLPLKISVVDMIEIGAGGGSLARVDHVSGLMKVGPRSAGSMPGPVAYGLGGIDPTVTDADLVLGRLDPAYFLGGEMALDLKKVERAFADRISAHIDVNPDDAALGVQRLVDEMMVAATRMHLAEKGKDPRRYSMIAFGGAGPVHAWNLARLLKMKHLIVPLGAGVASALGFLVAPPATDTVRSYAARLDKADWERVNGLLDEMKRQSLSLLVDAGAEANTVSFEASAEMRYVGQGFEVRVVLPSLVLGAGDLPGIVTAFNDNYREQFGRLLDETPIEILSLRVAAFAPSEQVNISNSLNRAEQSLTAVPRAKRNVRFEGYGWRECPVYDRYKLAPGAEFAGPALVEERESTCVVGPHSQIRVDDFFNLHIELNLPTQSFDGEPHAIQ